MIAVDTVQELHTTIQSAVKTMRSSNYPITAIVSASELFSRFITLATFDDKTADECKKLMLHRGEMFLKKLLEARNIIAKQCAQFVTDGCVSDLLIIIFTQNNISISEMNINGSMGYIFFIAFVSKDVKWSPKL